jgi:hypothetical protein
VLTFALEDAAGWDDCLDMLAMAAAGETPERPRRSEGWQPRYDEYRRRGFPAGAAVPQ